MSGRKETVLDLAKFVDKGVQVKLTGGRQVTGTLKGYDQLLNLVLDEAVEFLRDPDDPLKTTDQTRSLGLIEPVNWFSFTSYSRQNSDNSCHLETS
ncbi:Sm-like protein lsm7 [Trifolium repens]|nr:Sm-like protein lsm7 [Trifolium repens]